jgi:hypothetical protein
MTRCAAATPRPRSDIPAAGERHPSMADPVRGRWSHADGRSHEHQAVTVADPGEGTERPGQRSRGAHRRSDRIMRPSPFPQMCSASADEP